MSLGIFDWDQLDSNPEIMEEIREGFRRLYTRELCEFIIATVICELGISLAEIKEFRDKIIDLNGDPLEYIDEDSGKISLDAY